MFLKLKKMNPLNKKHTDLTYLKELSNGSKEFINQMISIFMSQTPEALDSINLHLKAKNFKQLRAVIHKMKPSFSFMGIGELENISALVENYADTETHLDELPELILSINTICTAALLELEEEKKQFV